jgi:hypothetical protein
VGKATVPEVERHEANVGAVHALHLDARRADVPVDLLAQLLDSVDELLENDALLHPRLEHFVEDKGEKEGRERKEEGGRERKERGGMFTGGARAR